MVALVLNELCAGTEWVSKTGKFRWVLPNASDMLLNSMGEMLLSEVSEASDISFIHGTSSGRGGGV